MVLIESAGSVLCKNFDTEGKIHSIFRDAEISLQQNFALVFFSIFFFQNHEKRRPGGTGKSGEGGVWIASTNFLH